MDKKNYDNALTKLEQDNFDRDLNELLENIDRLNYLEKNKTLIKEEVYLSEAPTLWGKIKYGLSKLGRYKAGGKIFGKSKVDQEWGAKIATLLAKQSNTFIKDLDSKIKELNKGKDGKAKGEFPNNQDQEIFLQIVTEIASIYDSIVAATKKKPEEKGFLPIDLANEIIEDLVTYTQKFLDVDLTGVYTVMDSEEEKDKLITDDIDLNEDESKDKRKELQARKAQDRETIRMGKKGLASNRLPLLLNIAGGVLGLAGWVTQTDWFREMFTTLKTTTVEKTKVITDAVNQGVNIDPQGFSYTLQNNLPTETIPGAPDWANNAVNLKLGPSAPIENLQKAAEFYGQGDASKGIEVMSKTFLAKGVQADSITNLKAQLADTARNKTVGDVFNHAEQTWGSKGQLFQQAPASSVKGFLIKILTSKAVKFIGTGATVATIPLGIAKLIAAGPLLGKLGVILILGGAAVKLMRMKGKKQSRAKTLQDLLNIMAPVEASKQNQPVLPDTPGGGDAGGDNICNEGDLNEINKLLNKVKADSKNLNIFKEYSKDEEFRNIFFSSIADVNQSIKINKKPLVQTLKDLRSQGLIEAPTGRQRKYLKFKLDFQNFMNDVFKLFVLLRKCEYSETAMVIKEFYKQLYRIATEGKNAGVKSKVQFDKKAETGVGGEGEPEEEIDTPPSVPPNYLKGNRNMQLVYLSQYFLPEGKSLWSNLNLKEGTGLPGGFFDAALGQGKVNSEKYLEKFHSYLEDKNKFTKKTNLENFIKKVKNKKNQALISWVRNTRKNVAGLFNKIKKEFPEFDLGKRQRLKVNTDKGPGEANKAMATQGESLNGRYDLITELNLGPSANQSGYNQDLLMKNLPQFMEMLAMMYYGEKGTKLEYNKKAVLDKCKKFGCKEGVTRKLKKTLSPNIEFLESENRRVGLMNEDANKDLRDKLFKKLAGNFSNFLNSLNKLKPMKKGKQGKPSDEEIAKRREIKKGKGGEKGIEGTFAGSAPRTKPPQLAHYERGDEYLMEEIKRIRQLMK